MAIHHELTRGSLEMMILATLSPEPLYGYLIQKRIQETTEGTVNLPMGTLYRVLNQLERDKAIVAKWDSDPAQHRKWYRLTAKGQRMLKQQTSQWRLYVESLHRILASVPPTIGGGSSSPITEPSI